MLDTHESDFSVSRPGQPRDLRAPRCSQEPGKVVAFRLCNRATEIAPIVEADSLDLDILFRASRYGKGGGDDYLHAALGRAEYLAFHPKKGNRLRDIFHRSNESRPVKLG